MMNNESLFLLQTTLSLFATAFFFRWGKESLMVWMGALALLANLFVSKQITLFGLDVTASDAYAVAIILSINLLQEYWGADSAKKGAQIVLVMQIAFMVFSQLHLQFIPNAYDQASPAFQAILGIYPRLLAASCITFYCVQLFDRWFFRKLQIRMGERSFVLRNGISITSSQFLDTALFSLLGLYGIVGNLSEIFFMSFAIKVIFISMLPLFTSLFKKKSYDVSL
jgi:uncharacterized integral membrane protein (TIGR00697 family)